MEIKPLENCGSFSPFLGILICMVLILNKSLFRGKMTKLLPGNFSNLLHKTNTYSIKCHLFLLQLKYLQLNYQKALLRIILDGVRYVTLLSVSRDVTTFAFLDPIQGKKIALRPFSNFDVLFWPWLCRLVPLNTDFIKSRVALPKYHTSATDIQVW